MAARKSIYAIAIVTGPCDSRMAEAYKFSLHFATLIQWALIYPTSTYPELNLIYSMEDWGTKNAAYYCIDSFLPDI